MTSNTYTQITEALRSQASTEQASILSRFFKTGPGQYGEGDMFLGIKVPVTRSVVKKFSDSATIDTCIALINSPWHEERLAGFLLLIQLYRKAKKQKHEDEIQDIVRTYITLIPKGNNWDLVDLVCEHILGDYLLTHPQESNILYSLASSLNLWENRVSMVSTHAHIRALEFDYPLALARIHLNHTHDLMHKATGWMLREIGKRNEQILIEFLNTNTPHMPRTALRYAIEKFPEQLRKHYLSIKHI